MSDEHLTNAAIAEVLKHEIFLRSGTIHEVYDDGERLFARGVLPFCEEVRPGDRINGGVAVRATDKVIVVHPFILRECCRNGTIMAQVIENRTIERSDELSAWAKYELQRAIAACCQQKIFTFNANKFRESTCFAINACLGILATMERKHVDQSTLNEVVKRFLDGERTAYGLLNAVTSVARDTADPWRRWYLEEFGGGIAARIVPEKPTEPPSRATFFRRSVRAH